MDSRTLPVAGGGCAREQKPPSLTVELSRAAARPNVGTSRAGRNECPPRRGSGEERRTASLRRSRDLPGLLTTEARSNKAG